MDQGHHKCDGMLREPARNCQIPSAISKGLLPGGVLWWLLNTLRLATGANEVVSVLRFVFKALIWQLKGSLNAQADETLHLRGVKHVLGLGTGEPFALPEIYWAKSYERLQDFAPQPGWTVFDVGANSGVYTVQQARRGAHVYAFEPNPDCYRRLQKSVRVNNLESRVTAANVALGAAAGSAELLVPGRYTLLGSLRPERELITGGITARSASTRSRRGRPDRRSAECRPGRPQAWNQPDRSFES
jgi:FkbM family methyltransferase